MYTCTYTYIRTYLYTYVHIHTYILIIHAHIYTRTQVMRIHTNREKLKQMITEQVYLCLVPHTAIGLFGSISAYIGEFILIQRPLLHIQHKSREDRSVYKYTETCSQQKQRQQYTSARHYGVDVTFVRPLSYLSLYTCIETCMC